MIATPLPEELPDTPVCFSWCGLDYRIDNAARLFYSFINAMDVCYAKEAIARAGLSFALHSKHQPDEKEDCLDALEFLYDWLGHVAQNISYKESTLRQKT